ncbi:MAG: hypothetical protein LBL25_02880, partial [Oscillospiraceae bacterium]|nr:hypothetical protein [Oscillospiraceae bacterium]
TTVVPFLNITASASVYLFDPLLNGYIGYYLLGYMLGKYELSVNLRAFIYVCGIAGFAVGFIGNIISSANGAGDLIFNMGYSLPSYLVAAALFVLVKYGSGNRLIGKAAPVLTPMADASFGVYWIHALVLRLAVGLPPLSRSPAINLSAVFLSVTACSFGVTLVAKRVWRSRKSNGGGCNSS